MPYKRTYRRRYRRYPRRKMGALDYALRALKIANRLRGLINVEWKNHDVSYTGSPNTSGDVQELCAIPQGDTAITRDGNSVLLKSLFFQSEFRQNASSTGITTVRFIVFADRYSDGANVPSVTDVLKTADPESLINLGQPNRFRILYDKKFTMNLDGDSRATTFKFFKKFSNKHLRYPSSSTTVPLGYTVNVLVISNEATNTPTQDTQFRVRFIDN